MSAWRKGCGGLGERPRLYEQVSSAFLAIGEAQHFSQVSVTTDWAMTVIREDKERDERKRFRSLPHVKAFGWLMFACSGNSRKLPEEKSELSHPKKIKRKLDNSLKSEF